MKRLEFADLQIGISAGEELQPRLIPDVGICRPILLHPTKELVNERDYRAGGNLLFPRLAHQIVIRFKRGLPILPERDLLSIQGDVPTASLATPGLCELWHGKPPA